MTVSSADAGYINVLKSIQVTGTVIRCESYNTTVYQRVFSISSGTSSYSKLGSSLYLRMTLSCGSSGAGYYPDRSTSNGNSYSPIIYVESLSGSTCYYRTISY